MVTDVQPRWHLIFKAVEALRAFNPLMTPEQTRQVLPLWGRYGELTPSEVEQVWRHAQVVQDGWISGKCTEHRPVYHACTCKSMDVRHPFNHNVQVRERGRCSCYCHGRG